MSVQIKLKRGDAADWISQNTILASGEPGYEIDTGRLKIGNGVTAWNSLPYSYIVPSGFVAGTGINLNLGSNSGSLTISTNNIPISAISGFNEAVDDRIGSGLFVAGTGISLVYNDSGNSFTVSATGLIANPANNRILTSRDSTSTGIDAESNLIFDGSLLTVSGNLTALTGILDILSLNTNNGAVSTQGQIGWNNTEGTVDIAIENNLAMQINEHRVLRIRNTTGSTLYKGQVVYASGVHANGIITPNLYVADGSIQEIRFIGMILGDVNINNNGFAIDFGHVNNIDTRGNVATNYAVGDETWADGDILYVHPTVAGKLTKVEPKHAISVAYVLDAANNGKIFVRPTSFGDLNYLHDVNTSGATNGQFLQYNSVTDYWVPSSSGNFTTLLVNGTGVSISGHTHSSSDITDFTEAVQDVVGASGFLVGQSGISISYNDGSNSLTITGGGGGGATISNAGDNRILTSDGTSTGINGESNLTFNGTSLSVTGDAAVDNIKIDGNTISSTNTNGNITLAPNGTGDVYLDADTLRVGDSNATATITTNGSGSLILNTNGGTNSGNITISHGSNANITLTPNGTGDVYLNSDSVVIGDVASSADAIITTNGGGIVLAPTTSGPLRGRTTGNNRGTYSTDWQRNALTNSQVASGSNSVIGGGNSNTASGDSSTVGGGQSNIASNLYSVVAGGSNNTASGSYSTVAGGGFNTANNTYATVAGGYTNNYTYGAGQFSFVGGGSTNNCETNYSTIAGGENNRITDPNAAGAGLGGSTHCVIGGGYNNLITSVSAYNAIFGGTTSQIGGENCTICGGGYHVIQSGFYSSILGGQSNTIQTDVYFSSIVNGSENIVSISGDYAVAGGKQANASLYGEQAYSAGYFHAIGDAETRRFILRGRDTTTSPIHLKLDGDLTGSRYLYIPDWTSWYYTVKVIARRNMVLGTSSGPPNSDTAAYRFEGSIENRNNDGSSCVLLGNVKTVIHEDNAAWDCDISIMWNNNNAYLDIACTYDHTTEDVYWVANVEVVQVSVPIEGPANILACGFGGFADGQFSGAGYYNDREYYQLTENITYNTFYLFWDGNNFVISSSLGGTALYSSQTYSLIGNDWTIVNGASPGGDTYDYSITSTCPSSSSSSSNSSSSGSSSSGSSS